MLLMFTIAVILLVLFQRSLFAVLRALRPRNKAVIFAYLVDYFGLRSTLYMPNVSCPQCNQFNAAYLIEPQRTGDCTYDKPVFLLVLVVSRPDYFDRRMAIRRSWGSISAYKSKSVRTFFTCGRTANNTVQVLLENEANKWDDIVQVFSCKCI